MRLWLFLILAFSYAAWADDNSTAANRAGTKMFSPDRGTPTVEDWRLIMPYWNKPAPKTQPKWSASFYTEFDSAPEGSGWLGIPAGSTYIQNFAELDYNWSKDTIVFVKPMWNTAYAPEGSKTTLIVSPGKSATKMGDTVIGFTEKNIFTWDGGGSFNSFFRYYAPTAESDRTTGLQGMLYARGQIDQPVNSWFRVAYDAKFWYALQTQDVYLDPNDSSQYKRTYDKEFLHYLTAVVSFSKHFKFYQSAGFDYTWMNGLYGDGYPTPTSYTSLFLDTSFGTDLMPNVDLRVGVSDVPGLNMGTAPQLFQSGEYYYYLWFVISI